jgi:hypothetical protein
MRKRAPLFPALQITSACNKRCKTCLRPSGEKPFCLSKPIFSQYLGDLRRLSNSYDIKYQFVTGGEPTLWRDGDQDIVDILIACRGLEFMGLVTMPTNGRRFEGRVFAREFVERLSARTASPSIVGISIASYQGNLTGAGCVALDNLLAASSQPGSQVIPIVLVTLSNKDDTFQTLDAIYPNVAKRVTALAPLGIARSAEADCPSLYLHHNDKSTLGSFLPHFQRDVMGKLRLSESDFFCIPNHELLDRLSLFNNCGCSPFIDQQWNYCLPFREDRRFQLGPIGAMTADALAQFFHRHPAIRAIRERGILSAVKSYKTRLSEASASKLDQLLSGAEPVSVAYRGCMLCKKLGDLGIIEEMLCFTD